MFLEQDYRDAIKFALNYPPAVDGWYDFNLCGYYVRSCLNWKGKKAWS